MNSLFKLVACITLFLFCFDAYAVKLHSLFNDHMVLQKGVPVPVWGTGDEGESITVIFHNQTLSTTVKDGMWMLRLSPLPYSFVPETLTVAGKNTLHVSDVLVGEVWLCSGQSNMERQLGPRPPQPLITNWEKERDNANYPLIREYYVPLSYSPTRINDVHSSWTVCSPQTVSDFSAVAYFFARDLHRDLKVPIGIIFSAYGGTPAEDWTDEEVLKQSPDLFEWIKNYNLASTGWRPQAKILSGLYNGMIHPLLPYAIKGVAFYQGEANNDYPKIYASILPIMIKNWRDAFAQENFPFLLVQIAPHKDMRPETREAQFKVSQQVRNTALIVTVDCGDAEDIHPAFKQPVGERLSLAARALAYGESIEYSGPQYKAFKITKDKITIEFSHTGKGLMSKGVVLSGFTVAGTDLQFVPAKARIKKNKIVVRSEHVPKPIAVRYGWSNVPQVNLFNKDGLPASPFRTDKD